MNYPVSRLIRSSNQGGMRGHCLPGRDKTFSIINVNALNIDLAVDAISQYAFILTRVRETATIMKAKLMVHLGEVVDRFDTDQCISRARNATKDFVLPEGGYTRDKSVKETSGS